MSRLIKAFLATAVLASAAQAERINHAGRILGTLPVVTNSTLFNTSSADAVVCAMQIFPTTSAWNEDISRQPVLPNSYAMISRISSDLAATRRTLRVFQEMNFVLAPDSQPLVPIHFVDYPDESDLNGGTFPYGRWPLPPNLPVEGWPSQTEGQTLAQWQQDVNSIGGDRHAIVVRPNQGSLWEMWQAQLVGTDWQASNGATFDLNSNALRPLGWTSADAAGLPMFPALLRYDEVARGITEHACRIVVARTRREYIYPATHFASTIPATETNVPAMGQRLRLKSAFVIPADWDAEEKALLVGLKKYGAIVADNGNFFSISVTPDDRWPANAFSHISTIGITNFEVIQTTGPNEGPRSPGPPVAYAGTDQTVGLTETIRLGGFVQFVERAPTIRWTLYSGPGAVIFGAAAQTNTTAHFSAAGVYTLMLSADDGVHAVAYDAVAITVLNTIHLSVSLTATQLRLDIAGCCPPYVIEQSSLLFPSLWSGVATTSLSQVNLSILDASAYFRVRAQE